MFYIEYIIYCIENIGGLYGADNSVQTAKRLGMGKSRNFGKGKLTPKTRNLPEGGDKHIRYAGSGVPRRASGFPAPLAAGRIYPHVLGAVGRLAIRWWFLYPDLSGYWRL
jgi:hypothetical protein